MKRIIISYIVCLLMLPTIQAQVSKTIDLSEAGTLSSKIKLDEIKTDVDLTITGKLDARDFRYIRDTLSPIFLPNRRTLNLDISKVSIDAYTGKAGTYIAKGNIDLAKNDTTLISYPKNAIPDYAYTVKEYYFSPLKKITLPKGITSIGNMAFKNNRLTNIVIPDSVTLIGNSAFEGCTVLKDVTIPSSVTLMGNGVFKNCVNLVSATIASSTTGFNTFDGCGALVIVDFQSTVTKIENAAFQNCRSITKLNLPANLTLIGKNAFYGCQSLTLLEFPSLVTTIDSAAFRYCSSLFSIRIPSSVTKISANAFANTNLQLIYNYSINPVKLDNNNTFSNNYSSAYLHVPSGSKGLYEKDTNWGMYKNIIDDVESTFSENGISYNILGKDSAYVVLGNYSGIVSIPSVVSHGGVNYTVVDIERYAFAYSGVTSVEVPATITKIEDGTFFNSKLLKNISLPSTITSIGEKVFVNCYVLESISLPLTLKSIGSYAFSGCFSIQEIIIPSGILAIEESSFAYCSNLKTVSLPSSLTTIGNNSFSNCVNIDSISLPSSLKTIGSYAFTDCYNIPEIIIPSGILVIENGSFSNCKRLKSVSLPSSLTTIGNNSFYYCDSLKSVSFPDSLKTIGNFAFTQCSSIKEVLIPSRVRSIGEEAFGGCISVTKVSIPASVTNIEKNAFFLCNGLFSLDSKNDFFVMKNGILCKKSNNTIIKCPTPLMNITISADMIIDNNEFNPFADCKGNFTVDSKNQHLSVKDGVLYNSTGTQLIKYPFSVYSIFTIPEKVNSITNCAFYGCSTLTKITIPLSVQDIGSGFGGCTKLTDIYIKYKEEFKDAFKGESHYFEMNYNPYFSPSLPSFNDNEISLNIPWRTGSNWLPGTRKETQFSPWGYFRSKKSSNAEDVSTWEASYSGYKEDKWIQAEYMPDLQALGSVVIDSTHVVTVTDSLLIPALQINNKGELKVKSNARLFVKNNIDNKSIISLLSDINGTALFIGPNIKGTNNYGTSHVQQYLTAGRNWYLSSPVKNDSSIVFDKNNTIYRYDETKGSSNPWISITDVNTSLSVGKGYVYSPTKTGEITFKGELNYEKSTVLLTRTKGHMYEGYNLIGNPFTAYLDWSKTNTEDLMPSIWYKTTAATSATTGEPTYTFQSYNVLSKVATKNGTNVATNLIPPMQAFWVRVADSLTTGKVIFNPEYRSFKDVASNKLKVKSQTSTTQPILRLDVSNGSYTDQAVVYLNSNALNSFDNYDTPKMLNNSAELAEIYTLSDKENLAINGLNALPYNSELAIGFNTSRPGKFTIKASEFSNFESDTKLLLKDYVNNTITDLGSEGSYSFNSGSANTKSRFALIFRTPASTIDVDSNPTVNAWVTEANGMLHINGNVAKGSSLDVYNFMGQQVISKSLNAGSNQNSVSLNSGVYIVTLTQNGQKTTQKFILK